MIHRRGVVPALVLLSLLAVGLVLQLLRGPAAASPAPASAPRAESTPTAQSADAQAVLRSLAAVQRAYEAGNVRRLCHPGALLDPAVIRAQNAGGGCESEIESLVAHEPSLRFTVREVALLPDLATVVVSVPGGTGAPVDFVRRGGRWLLSFSAGDDPMPVLAGTL